MGKKEGGMIYGNVPNIFKLRSNTERIRDRTEVIQEISCSIVESCVVLLIIFAIRV